MEMDALDTKDTPLDSGYTVVARRYRPKQFGELVGQQHVSQALQRALSAGRVGHAYLFTGARGVGKTSTARIFAKALNVTEEMDEALASDVARCIDAGDDMDVIEIDGVSNRGIDEIRQLRANVHGRPSRCAYKIYIIDEVHMLTAAAFNALLKTLEEPPPHVKFIFCTTDPDKIPITVLSRCQRFDFAPVGFDAIQSRLRDICASEGFEAEDDALALLARRASGSMRDSQSLLEQVMSFSQDRVTVDQVHALLGTADEGLLRDLVLAVQEGDPLFALRLVDEATRSGAEAGQLAEQLLNYLRDLMSVGVGGGPEVLKLANPSGHQELSRLAQNWGTHAILSAIQILDEALVRMRSSVSAVALLEVALVQISQLESLVSIPELMERVALGDKASSGGKPSKPVASREKKKPEGLAAKPNLARSQEVKAQAEQGLATTPSDRPEGEPQDRPSPADSETVDSRLDNPAISISEKQVASLKETSVSPQPQAANATGLKQADQVDAGSQVTEDSTSVQRGGTTQTSAHALQQWQACVNKLDDLVADFARMAVGIEPLGADRWKVLFAPGAVQPAEYCKHPTRKSVLERAVQSEMGRPISLEFVTQRGKPTAPPQTQPQASVRAQKLREMSEHPYVKRLCEVLDGEIIRIDLPRDQNSAGSSTSESASTMQ